jgi:hypothetical protein
MDGWMDGWMDGYLHWPIRLNFLIEGIILPSSLPQAGRQAKMKGTLLARQLFGGDIPSNVLQLL